MPGIKRDSDSPSRRVRSRRPQAFDGRDASREQYDRRENDRDCYAVAGRLHESCDRMPLTPISAELKPLSGELQCPLMKTEPLVSAFMLYGWGVWGGWRGGQPAVESKTMMINPSSR